MAKKTFLSACVLLALLCAGCSLLSQTTDTFTGGSLAVSIADGVSVSRTIVPGISMEPATYEIQGAGPDGASFTRTLSGSTSVTIDELAFGTWTVTVTAKNASATAIGSASGAAAVHTNQTTSLDLTVVPYDGFGTLALTLAWNAADVETPQVDASLLPVTGSARTLGFTVNGASASWSASDVATGYHTLVLKLNDNGILVMGAVEVVRIVKDAATSGAFTFDNVNAPGGSLAVSITPEMADPLTVSISGASATKPVNGTMSLAASIAETGVNATFVWYVNGESKGCGTGFAFDDTWDLGYYRIDVCAFSADGSRAGSATCSVQVTAAETVSGELTGPASGTMGGQRAYDSVGNVYIYTYQGGLYKVAPDGTKTLLLALTDIPGYPNGLLGSPLVLDDNTLLIETGVSGVMKLNLTTKELTAYASLTSYYYGISNLLLDKNGTLVAGRTRTLILPDGSQATWEALGCYSVYTDSALYKSFSYGVMKSDLDGGNAVHYQLTDDDSIYGLAMGPDGSVYAAMGAGSPTDVPICVYKLSPQGTVSEFATVPNWVDSLVSDGGSHLYAAGFKSGAWSSEAMEDIYRIDLDTGEVTLVE